MDKELIKLKMLLDAVNKLHRDDVPDFLGELKEAAQDVLNGNPDITFEEWKCALMEQYPTEIVDALGTNQEEVKLRLCEIWKETKRK